VDVYIA